MRTTFFAILMSILIFTGCAHSPKSFKQSALDDFYPVLNDEQYHKLESLQDENQIAGFIDNVWLEIAASSNEDPDLLKDEYLKRLKYANENFPDRRGYGKSNRKRIYLIYGPPVHIDRFENADLELGQFAKIKSVEVWYYMAPGKTTLFPNQGNNLYKGEKKFIFGDKTGTGIYSLIYSSEDAGEIDLRMLKLH